MHQSVNRRRHTRLKSGGQPQLQKVQNSETKHPNPLPATLIRSLSKESHLYDCNINHAPANNEPDLRKRPSFVPQPNSIDQFVYNDFALQEDDDDRLSVDDSSRCDSSSDSSSRRLSSDSVDDGACSPVVVGNAFIALATGEPLYKAPAAAPSNPPSILSTQRVSALARSQQTIEASHSPIARLAIYNAQKPHLVQKPVQKTTAAAKERFRSQRSNDSWLWQVCAIRAGDAAFCSRCSRRAVSLDTRQRKCATVSLLNDVSPTSSGKGAPSLISVSSCNASETATFDLTGLDVTYSIHYHIADSGNYFIPPFSSVTRRRSFSSSHRTPAAPHLTTAPKTTKQHRSRPHVQAISSSSYLFAPCFYVPVIPLLLNGSMRPRTAGTYESYTLPKHTQLSSHFDSNSSQLVGRPFVLHHPKVSDKSSYSRSAPHSPLMCYAKQSIVPYDNSGASSTSTTPEPGQLSSDDDCVSPDTAPPRQWYTTGSRSSGTAGFLVMCYNVLCDKYCTRQLYPYCPSWALNWEYRKMRIMEDIRNYRADIITLQEVETSQYHDFFLPELKADGYEGIFSPKSRAKTMMEGDRGHVDGCAIFYRTEKFELVKEHLIEFNQLAMANAEGSKDMLNRVMTKDNIAIAALLQTKDKAFDHGLPTDYQTKQYLMVSTAHIHWDPEFCDVKLIQSMMLISELKSIIEDYCVSLSLCSPPDCNAVPLILCGDLNSLPNSGWCLCGCYIRRPWPGWLFYLTFPKCRHLAAPGVIEYLEHGKVTRKHDDFREHGYDACLQKLTMTESLDLFTHPFRLAQAHPPELMAFTNYTFDFKGVIDYVFYSNDHLRKVGVLCSPDPDWFERNKVLGCPNPLVPSDHVPLVIELELNSHRSGGGDRLSQQLDRFGSIAGGGGPMFDSIGFGSRSYMGPMGGNKPMGAGGASGFSRR